MTRPKKPPMRLISETIVRSNGDLIVVKQFKVAPRTPPTAARKSKERGETGETR